MEREEGLRFGDGEDSTSRFLKTGSLLPNGPLYSDIFWHFRFTFWLILPGLGGERVGVKVLLFGTQMLLAPLEQPVRAVRGCTARSRHNAAWRRGKTLSKP